MVLIQTYFANQWGVKVIQESDIVSCTISFTEYYELHISRAVNQLGKLRDNLDANLTYEGDNNVILLQSSNYLFDVYEKKKAGV